MMSTPHPPLIPRYVEGDYKYKSVVFSAIFTHSSIIGGLRCYQYWLDFDIMFKNHRLQSLFGHQAIRGPNWCTVVQNEIISYVLTDGRLVGCLSMGHLCNVWSNGRTNGWTIQKGSAFATHRWNHKSMLAYIAVVINYLEKNINCKCRITITVITFWTT